MRSRRVVLTVLCAAAVASTVAACTSSSDGNGTPSATATVTSTAPASSSPAAPTSPASTAPTTTAPAGNTASPSSSAASSGHAAGPGLCTPTVATFSIGENEGAAGTSFFDIHVTNASKTPCVTTGYPGIALLGTSGRQILQATRSNGGATPATIVLQPGQQATAQVGSSSMAANGAACEIQSPAFLLTLPDNTDSTRISHDTLACSVRVGAFRAGATGA